MKKRKLYFSLCILLLAVSPVLLITPAFGHECGECEQWNSEAEACVPCACGDEPTQEQRDRFENWFPNLEWGQWSITGDADPNYNCIAWSVGETTTWYVDVVANKVHESDLVIDVEWGDGDGTMTTTELDAFYDAKGYEPTGTGHEDADIMYYNGFHGARKTDYGMWESKCGSAERIDHVWDQLNGDTYGTPTRYYKQK